jgi:hypothetical protein
MVPVEWPVAAADEGGGAFAARVAGGSRLPIVRLDFFLDPTARLTEQERALMAGMLADLVNSIGDEFRSRLGGLEAANDEGEQLAQRLRRSGLLDIADLVRLLLHRAEDERISIGLRAGREGSRPRFLQSLVSDENAEISAAAMALILARGRRRDRFGGPRILFDDLSAEAAVALVNAIAAALRTDLAKRLDPADADERLATACRSVLAGHDEGNRLEARLFELVHALGEAGRLDESLIRSTLDEGEASLLAEALGRTAGILFQPAWEHLTGGSGKLALLLRMSGASRTLAGEVIARFAEVVTADPESEIAVFDSLSEKDVDSARKWLRLDPAYRSAIETLASGRGQRTL